MKDTWASGAIELLNHADSHLKSRTAFDKRIAFISVDNAVENIVRTFLSLPEEKSGVRISRREIEDANNSFPRLLKILYNYAGDKLIGIDDADIEHYHRIRNLLYHQPTGLSVDDQYLTAYRGIAGVLLQNLLNEKVDKTQAKQISLETLILNWNNIEQKAKKEIEKHGFSTSYKWEEKFVHSGISEEIAKKISELRKARNKLVHSSVVDQGDIKFWVDKSNEILKEIENNINSLESTVETERPVQNPVCFISYSWESNEHSVWVRHLAEQLQQNGVNTILDQWDLRPGMDMAHFMENSIRSSDYILLVCTPLFTQKANEGTGGVGYEKNIVTAEIINKIKPDTNIVPILRSGDKIDAIPTYLGSKIFIDFRHDDNFEQKMEELLRHIYGVPKFQRPSPGQSPSFFIEATKNNTSNSFRIADIEQIALQWQKQSFPYFIVESLQDIQKAYVRHPPTNTDIKNPVTLSFLLLAGFHFGGNWCFWLTKNATNLFIKNTFESCFSVSYRGPVYRALFALQFLGDEQLFAYLPESGEINESTKNLIRSYAMTGRVVEYLTELTKTDKGKTGQRAASVIKEINQYCIAK